MLPALSNAYITQLNSSSMLYNGPKYSPVTTSTSVPLFAEQKSMLNEKAEYFSSIKEAKPGEFIKTSCEDIYVQGLPSWLSFDHSTCVLSGTPPIGSTGQFPITMTSSVYSTTVTTAVNVVPKQPPLHDERLLLVGDIFSLPMPKSTFIDPNENT